FTPTAVGATASASSSSPAECTSTRIPSPWSRAARASVRRPSEVSARTIKSTALAPPTLASYSCSSSRMKSLRSTGTGTALATRARSSSEPPKCSSSVRTEIATAPPRVYARACATGSRSSRIAPAEGERYIRRAHNESRGIEVVPPRGQTGATDLPLYGLVAAGAPIEAVSGPDTIAVPDELIPRRGRSYVLKVRGQSMIDEHIKDGDFIVVHERNQADNGQTVVALVHGSSATVKRFYREPGGWIRLEPANPTMTALRVNERDVVVQGVVVGVIRKY